jgi:hypothetical protein
VRFQTERDIVGREHEPRDAAHLEQRAQPGPGRTGQLWKVPAHQHAVPAAQRHHIGDRSQRDQVQARLKIKAGLILGQRAQQCMGHAHAAQVLLSVHGREGLVA